PRQHGGHAVPAAREKTRDARAMIIREKTAGGTAAGGEPVRPRDRSEVTAQRCERSDVEPELDHVTVLHDVVLALHPDLARRARRGHRTGLDQVVVRDDLGLDEAALEVAVDDTGRLRSGRALADRPGARLLGPGGEEGLQAEGVEADPGELRQAGLLLADGAEQLGRVLL